MSCPIHLTFFLVILLFLKSFSWYINYEYMFEGFFDQVKLVFILSPLILLLVISVLSNFGTGPRRRSPIFLQDSPDRAGGIPWRVGFILMLLFLMISYQSSFQERWFPLLSRRSSRL
ncbi:hypothetical protein LOK49_LG03G02855 [Camellia lanceoleosa]|uniref:Uncharacterized protein n=1 Tax=Camellia lanceoleosa TaxID=1840588 RepID=A0ACC0ICA0_9ERIC|nr:hypothetical protein LOK49_LG03G02855 [Camellia lanceoleosa]